MDITMLPPSTILSHHSHHVYHPGPGSSRSQYPLLPSALPRQTNRFTPSFSYTPCPHHMSGLHSYRYRPQTYECLPPFDGSSPISRLPDEMWLEILKFMDRKDLFKIRSVNSKLAGLALSASLHQSMTLTSVPPLPLPAVMTTHLLPPIKHLHLFLSSYPMPSASVHPTLAIHTLLKALPPDQLRTLSLAFAVPYLLPAEWVEIMRRIGGRLEKLDLRGNGIFGKLFHEWIDHVGTIGPGLQELDIGFTCITELPSMSGEEDTGEAGGNAIQLPTSLSDLPTAPCPSASAFRNIKSLSLASCNLILPPSISTFLRQLPPSLVSLDISRMEQVSFEALWGMKVTQRLPSGEIRPNALKEIKVVGIDHLTRLDIRRLKRHWEGQRRACDCFPPVQLDALRQTEQQRQRVWGEPTTPMSTSAVHIPVPSPHTPFSLRRESLSPASASTSISSSGSSSSAMSRILTPESADIELSPPQPSSYHEKYPHPFLLSPPSSSTIYHRMDLDPPPLSQEAKELQEMQELITVNIIHSAILESEDEAGYRQFIGEVAGGTIGLGLMDWERGF